MITTTPGWQHPALSEVREADASVAGCGRGASLVLRGALRSALTAQLSTSLYFLTYIHPCGDDTGIGMSYSSTLLLYTDEAHGTVRTGPIPGTRDLLSQIMLECNVVVFEVLYTAVDDILKTRALIREPQKMKLV